MRYAEKKEIGGKTGYFHIFTIESYQAIVLTVLI
jgi:hypothetical protein